MRDKDGHKQDQRRENLKAERNFCFMIVFMFFDVYLFFNAKDVLITLPSQANDHKQDNSYDFANLPKKVILILPQPLKNLAPPVKTRYDVSQTSFIFT